MLKITDAVVEFGKRFRDPQLDDGFKVPLQNMSSSGDVLLRFTVLSHLSDEFEQAVEIRAPRVTN